jgi:hypothetical protein
VLESRLAEGSTVVYSGFRIAFHYALMDPILGPS